MPSITFGLPKAPKGTKKVAVKLGWNQESATNECGANESSVTFDVPTGVDCAIQATHFDADGKTLSQVRESFAAVSDKQPQPQLKADSPFNAPEEKPAPAPAPKIGKDADAGK